MKTEKVRKPLGVLGKIAAFYVGFLSLVLIAVSILDRFGYTLIEASMQILGVALLIFSLVVIFLVWLVHKIRPKIGKIVAGMLSAVVVLFGAVFAVNMISQYVILMLPTEYATLTSSNGTEAVILRGIDTGYENGGSEEDVAEMVARMDVRKADILENHPEEAEDLKSEEDYPVGAYGYYYVAYPKVAKIFYKKTADTEGIIYQGVNSEAKLNYVWRENGDLYLYLQDPEVGDTGEFTLYH